MTIFDFEETSLPSMERWVDDNGQVVLIHAEEDCSGMCAIHHPSDHHMKEWPLVWRNDRQLMERRCPHNVGHPDVDHMEYVGIVDPHKAKIDGVHGCDGCCGPTA